MRFFYIVTSYILKKSPLFSIVIANYNHGKYLDGAIQSVLDQSCQDFELIVIDAGSTDDSVDIIKKYSKRLAWWVSETDNGQSDAFNKGFSRANGQFFFWLNADDVLLGNSLSRIKAAISLHPDFLWFAGNSIFYDANGFILYCTRGTRWRDIFFRNGHISVTGPTSIFHRSLFERVGGFNEDLKYTMDSDLWHRFMLLGYKYHRIRYYLWGFRIHEESKTSHAFNAPAIPAFAAEKDRLNRNDGAGMSVIGLYLHRVYKFISGAYLLSRLDTLRLKQMNVSDLL